MSVPMQLALDGAEVPMSSTTSRLGPNQRAVLRKMVFGSLTSTQAGAIIHERRGHCGFGAKDMGEYTGAGCCRYAVSDGSDVMRSLRERGFVEKQGGLWWLPRRDWG